MKKKLAELVNHLNQCKQIKSINHDIKCKKAIGGRATLGIY